MFGNGSMKRDLREIVKQHVVSALCVLPGQDHHGASGVAEVLISPDRATSETRDLATKFQVQFGLADSDDTEVTVYSDDQAILE